MKITFNATAFVLIWAFLTALIKTSGLLEYSWFWVFAPAIFIYALGLGMVMYILCVAFIPALTLHIDWTWRKKNDVDV